ncbi:hypothetical protein ACOMHN_021809 [Nucella lapillus]
MSAPQWDRYLRLLTLSPLRRKHRATYYAGIYSLGTAAHLTRFCSTDNFTIRPEEVDGVRTLVEKLRADEELHPLFHVSLNGIKLEPDPGGFFRDQNDNPQIVLEGKGWGGSPCDVLRPSGGAEQPHDGRAVLCCAVLCRAVLCRAVPC